MATARPRKLFVNIPVHDLKRSVDFYTRLGFAFDQRFTDDTATCMIVSDDAYFMLLTEERFREFAKKPVANPSDETAALFALTVGDRAEVDAMVDAAIGAGGSYAADRMDHGFMYGWSFYDPDGHHWEVVYMDASGEPGGDKR